MANGIWRALVITHRYLGVVVGLLMVMWFVSGIVMMYVPFPRISEAERLGVQSPIQWQACCRFGEGIAHTSGGSSRYLSAPWLPGVVKRAFIIKPTYTANAPSTMPRRILNCSKSLIPAS